MNVPLVTLTYSLTYSGLYKMLLYSVGKFSESFVYLRVLAMLLVIENSVVIEEGGVCVGFRFLFIDFHHKHVRIHLHFIKSFNGPRV